MFGDFGKMLKAAGEIKKRMPQMRRRLEESHYQADAGGGAVRATVNGRMALVDLAIAPEVLADPQAGAEMLADLVKAAVSAAQEKAAEAAAEMMRELTGGMELPGMDDFLGT